MNGNFYVLYVRQMCDDGKTKAPLPEFPMVGAWIKHILTEETAEGNSLWPRIQDGVRPAWAPDLLRNGYALVFKVEALPKMALQLGIKSNEQAAKERTFGNRRVLTFDDVWTLPIDPRWPPFYNPCMQLTDEDWWLSTQDSAPALASYIAPGGGVVMDAPKRLVDVVRALMSTPQGYPRPIPGLQADEDDYSAILNPLVPRLPVVPVTEYSPSHVDTTGRQGYAGMKLFRF
jgi:hypothetical protein